MEENSKKYTAFSTPDGNYQFRRMPFGLKNAPAQFSKIMHQVIGVKSFVEVYLDDIIIHSKTIEEHIQHIQTVAYLLRKACLKLKPSKCKWFARKAHILGFVVSGKTIEMDPEKVEAIVNRAPPKDLKQLQCFLGMTNYNRRFIKRYAVIVAPLYQCIKRKMFRWTYVEEKAFENLKKALTSKPILRQPDFKREFIIHTDASYFAISSILCQIDDDGNEYVVCYVSRILIGRKIHFGITEKECLAVVFSESKNTVSTFMVQSLT